MGGQKNPRQTWTGDSRGNGLVVRFPEVVTKVDNFKFPGRGQRETPVTDKEGALYIIGLLPGAVGRKYREEAAKLFLAYLDDPVKLGQIAVDRASTPEQVKQIESAARQKYLNTYHPLFDELGQRIEPGDRWTFVNVNSLNTKTVMGDSPKAIVSARGGQTARDNATDTELCALEVLQEAQKSGLVKRDTQGGKNCYNVCKEAAEELKAFLNKWLS